MGQDEQRKGREEKDKLKRREECREDKGREERKEKRQRRKLVTHTRCPKAQPRHSSVLPGFAQQPRGPSEGPITAQISKIG